MQTLLKPRKKVCFDAEKYFAIILDRKETDWINRNQEDIMHKLMLQTLDDTIKSKKKRYNKEVIVFNCERQEIFRK
jgi:hypothetical protein